MSGGPSNRTGAMHRLMVDALTAEAVGRLGAAGCPNLILRGPVLARELYADGTLRRYVDVDLLVAPTDLERAGAALRAAGFDLRRDHRERPLLAEPHAQEWRAPPCAPRPPTHAGPIASGRCSPSRTHRSGGDAGTSTWTSTGA